MKSVLDDLSKSFHRFVNQEKPQDKETKYLSTIAPNIIEWVTRPDLWNVPSTYKFYRQYQVLRDLFNLRCPVCNSNKPEAIDCWGKPQSYLEAELLLVWKEDLFDFECPKCRTTLKELMADGMTSRYNEAVIIAGMRSGKSYTGACIGGYLEHFCSALGVRGKDNLQISLGQEKSEWFEVTFAASTATQAKETIYAKYRQMRANSPWIQKYVQWVKAQEKQQGVVVEPWKYRQSDDSIADGYVKVRYNRVASDSAGIAGKTRIFASIDEWARLVNTESPRSAQELYRVLNQSLKTVRANAKVNNLPFFFGLFCNVTSPIAVDDPAMQLYTRANTGELNNIFSMKKSTWDFNPQLPKEEFDGEYQKDPVGAERDYGANPPLAASPFIHDPLRFWKSINVDRKPLATFNHVEMVDPTGREYIGLELERCDLEYVTPHYIFMDAGLTRDCFGLVMAHPEWRKVDKQEDINIQALQEAATALPGKSPPPDPRLLKGGDSKLLEHMYKAHSEILSGPSSGLGYEHRGETMIVVIDACVRIIPTNTRSVHFDSVVKVIEDLGKKVRIAQVAADKWNSESAFQQIRSMGILAAPVVLKPDHFMSFLNAVYEGQVSLLPPHEDDNLTMTDKGQLLLGTAQEHMAGESVALVELLKLSRSPDLKTFTNTNKGQIKGRDSDDLARCVIGAYHITNFSVVDEMANQRKRKAVKKRLLSQESPTQGGIFRGPKGF